MDPFGNTGFPTDPMVPIGLPKGARFNPIGSNDLDPFSAGKGAPGSGGMFMGREAFQNTMPGFKPFGDNDFDNLSPLRRPGGDPMGM